MSRRPYNSPVRALAAAETRRRITGSARDLFLADGYARTSMRAIARNAGVAERTVYLAYQSKAAILDDIIKTGLGGDDAAAEVSERENATTFLADCSLSELLDHVADVVAAILQRSARLLQLAEACAVTDSALADFLRRGHADARAYMGQIAAALDRRGALDPALDRERVTDILFAFISNDSPYLRLVDERGWTTGEYAAVVRRLVGSLLAPGAQRAG